VTSEIKTAKVTRRKLWFHSIDELLAFGTMTYEDRIQLNLRHAELHLSFLELE